jgi:hypothetical protein
LLLQQDRQSLSAPGVVPIWIYLPMPGVADAPEQSDQMITLAKRAGFVVADLSHWAEGHTPQQVKISPLDHHPNALGHQIIAERLCEAIRKDRALLPAYTPQSGK